MRQKNKVVWLQPLDTNEAIKIYDDMKRKDIKKREAQGYKFTHKKRELYETGYYDCYESLRRKRRSKN